MSSKKPLYLFLGILLSSCAASLPYSTDYPLTQELFRSRDGALSGRVPQGWFSSTDDSLAPALTAWFIRDDLSASLSLKELTLDERSAQQFVREGLPLLARFSAAFQLPPQSNPNIESHDFEMQGKKYCSYEIGQGVGKRRFVVFTVRGKYYECEARSTKGRWSVEDFNRLFWVQQSILSSLRY